MLTFTRFNAICFIARDNSKGFLEGLFGHLHNRNGKLIYISSNLFFQMDLVNDSNQTTEGSRLKKTSSPKIYLNPHLKVL